MYGRGGSVRLGTCTRSTRVRNSNGFYSTRKKTYQDDDDIVNEGFVLDNKALEALRAKIIAILIEDLPIRENESKHKD